MILSASIKFERLGTNDDWLIMTSYYTCVISSDVFARKMSTQNRWFRCTSVSDGSRVSRFFDIIFKFFQEWSFGGILFDFIDSDLVCFMVISFFCIKVLRLQLKIDFGEIGVELNAIFEYHVCAFHDDFHNLIGAWRLKRVNMSPINGFCQLIVDLFCDGGRGLALNLWWQCK